MVLAYIYEREPGFEATYVHARTTKWIYITMHEELALISNLTEPCLQCVRGEQLARRAANREEGACLDVYGSKLSRKK